MSSHTTSVLRRLNILCIVFKIVAFYKIKKTTTTTNRCSPVIREAWHFTHSLNAHACMMAVSLRGNVSAHKTF
jgi:hypothetical protein